VKLERRNAIVFALAVVSVSLLVVYLQELNANRQLHDQLIQLQDSLNQLQVRIDHLNRSQVLLRQEKQQLEQKLRRQTEQIELLQRERQQLGQWVESLRRERQRLQALLAQKNSQLESLRLINVTVYVLTDSVLRIENVKIFHDDRQVFCADLNVTVRNGTKLLSLMLLRGQITLQCNIVKPIVQQQEEGIEFVITAYCICTASETFEEDTEWYVRM